MTDASDARTPLLSICIPTLNRGAVIGETLESIVRQMTDEVELIIIDGGSSDDTEQVVMRFADRVPLRFVSPNAAGAVSSHAGFDRDVDRVVELSTGRYCWLMTDDDVLVPDAIETVLRAVRQGHALVVPNLEVRDERLGATLRARQLDIDRDRVYEEGDYDRAFGDLAHHLSFVGAVIIKREVWLSRRREPHYGSGFIHFCVVWQEPLPGTTMVIARPLVVIRYGNAHWQARPGRRFQIWIIDWPTMVWALPHYSDRAKRKAARKMPWRRLSVLLGCRALGTYSSEEYDRYVAPRLDSPVRRAAAAAIAKLPGPLLNAAAIATLMPLRKRFAIRLFDLEHSRFYPPNAARTWIEATRRRAR